MPCKALQQLVSSKSFERVVIAAIVLNSITLGLETSKDMMASHGDLLYLLDRLFLTLFSLEVILKLTAFRTQYFRDPWNGFDFIIVAIAWIPAAGPFSVLRALRILRALRLLSAVPQLRKVVSGLLTSLPGFGAVAALLVILFYIGAVMATKLFGPEFPEWFGSIGKSAYSLFQIMTLESWSMGIVRPVMQSYPYAWTFFVPFILVTSFTTLNLLIAVLVNSMQTETEAAAENRAQKSHDERVRIFQELEEIKAEIKSLKK